LWRHEFSAAADAALDALHRSYQNPLAHFLLGRALVGMKKYERAADAFRAAISLNPNFPEAHLRLAALFENQFGDADSAREHRGLARSMRRGEVVGAWNVSDPEPRAASSRAASIATDSMPPIAESLVVVTGLPRSGTSMLMQMLAAGGMRIVADAMREADEDNPRGYFEFRPVKTLFANSTWLCERRGAAIKIVAPLLTALPAGLPCRVILSERDLEEVLDSQERMLERRGRTMAGSGERRARLKQEYIRTLERIKTTMARRPSTRLITVAYGDAVSDPGAVARALNAFLDGGLDIGKMAAAVDPALHRNRSITASAAEQP